MGFSTKIKEDILVASARHCCVCHRYKGVKIEIHHIKPKEQGGLDSFDNAIALCFDCHSDAGHYFAKHPKGTKVSPSELIKHKKTWFENVTRNNIIPSIDTQAEISLCSGDDFFEFTPIFIEETTVYKDKDDLRKLDYKKLVEQMKTGNLAFDFFYNKIKCFDDFVDHMNGEDIAKYSKNDSNEQFDPQPIKYSVGTMGIGFTKNINLSTCVLKLKVINNGPEILEDFKVYLNFEGVIKASAINKRKSFLDLTEYKYNLSFKTDLSTEFTPSIPILVQNDFVELDPICFKPKQILHELIINWRIVARNYQKEGQLKINVSPVMHKEVLTKYVEKPENYKSKKTIRNKYKFE